MTYLLILFATYFVWLFLKSKNTFFDQDLEVLAQKRNLLIQVLNDRGVDTENDKQWLNAYYMFSTFKNYYKFDGATILADLDTIKGLDASAMVHDFEYLELRNTGFKNYLKGKLKADVNYGKNMRKLGITWLVAWSRVLCLIISTPAWMLIVFLKGKL